MILAYCTGLWRAQESLVWRQTDPRSELLRTYAQLNITYKQGGPVVSHYGPVVYDRVTRDFTR